MQHTVSIKENRVFHRAYKKGQFSTGKKFSVFAIENRDKKTNRLGIVVSKKVGNSVQRNRVRRLIREFYRLTESELKSGYDIVVSARESKRISVTARNKIKAVSIPDFNDVRKELTYHFKSLSLFEEKQEAKENEKVIH